jgi:hypothetical protein
MFFADTLSEMIDDSWSVHEPDVWAGFSAKTWQRVRTFGLYHMFFGRITGRTGLRNLSQRRLSNHEDLDRLTAELIRQRERFYRSIDASLVIESNAQWYGLLLALPKTGWRYRVVALVRDPRTWVASTLNHGRVFGYRDIVSRLGFRRLDPALVGDEKYVDRWRHMSDFQKVCWTWRATYEAVAASVENDPCARLFRYEDFFLSADRTALVANLLNFITDFEGRTYSWQLLPDSFDRRINTADRARFPDWRDWTEEQARQLDEICGPLMRRFDYGTEPEWRANLARADRLEAPTLAHRCITAN